MTCIYSKIDKYQFANSEIKIGSSTPKFGRSYSQDINLYLNFQINISELYSRLKTCQINSE